MNTRSFIFFTRILARAQISSLTSGSFFIEVLSAIILETTKTIYLCEVCQLRFYRPQFWRLQKRRSNYWLPGKRFYRPQFWRLQKPYRSWSKCWTGFIGHNFGDYKNHGAFQKFTSRVLSATILETTKTNQSMIFYSLKFYRPQFWRLQKPRERWVSLHKSFIGHNFGDYKNLK